MPLRLIFMGTPDFAVPTLIELAARGHEIDHLNGVLFIDHISKLKRDRIVKKFVKAAKRAETA